MLDYPSTRVGRSDPVLFYGPSRNAPFVMKPRWKLVAKVVASGCIAFHLIAIFAAPASIPPTSASLEATWSLCSPYLYTTNLNNGYHFFAPEPGASTLIEFVGTTSNGDIQHGVMPDKQRMRPRLLYHRYFMLTEFLGGYSESDPKRKIVIQTLAHEILKTQNLQQVELRLVRHRPSSRQEILIGDNLIAPETYERENLGTFTWTDFPTFN